MSNRLLLVLLVAVFSCKAKSQPFADEIQKFRREDSLHKPPTNPILFVGSSSFTKWTDVAQYFPGYTVLNRGFGGSTLLDVINYENDVVFKYNPKQIIIYCGENDIASSDTVTAASAARRFTTLFSDIRKQFPSVPIVFISIKPSPSRWMMRDRMIAANSLIKQFLEKEKFTTFVNVWNEMLGADARPRGELFISDSLHMNAKGYQIWQQKLAPILKN